MPDTSSEMKHVEDLGAVMAKRATTASEAVSKVKELSDRLQNELGLKQVPAVRMAFLLVFGDRDVVPDEEHFNSEPSAPTPLRQAA